jgi:uncharacterized membrane protein
MNLEQNITSEPKKLKNKRAPIAFALLILSFLGFLDAGYLTISHYTHISPACSVFSGCETVINSQFSTLFGIPIALFGAIYFFALFYLSIAVLTGYRPVYARLFNLSAYIGLLISIFLFLIQALILKNYCQYCLLSEIITLFIYIFSRSLLRKKDL